MKKVLSFLIIAVIGFTFIPESKAQVYVSYSSYSPYDYDFPYYVTDVIHNSYYGYQVVDAVSFYNGPHLAFGITLAKGGSYFDVVVDHYGRVINRVAYHNYPRAHCWTNYYPNRQNVVYYYPRGHQYYSTHKHIYVNRGYDGHHHRGQGYYNNHNNYGHKKNHKYGHDKHHNNGNKHYKYDNNHKGNPRIDVREPERRRTYKVQQNNYVNNHHRVKHDDKRRMERNHSNNGHKRVTNQYDAGNNSKVVYNSRERIERSSRVSDNNRGNRTDSRIARRER